MTITITIGKYGGFHIHFGYIKRICLGWISIDFYPFELDELFKEIIKNEG